MLVCWSRRICPQLETALKGHLLSQESHPCTNHHEHSLQNKSWRSWALLGWMCFCLVILCRCNLSFLDMVPDKVVRKEGHKGAWRCLHNYLCLKIVIRIHVRVCVTEWSFNKPHWLSSLPSAHCFMPSHNLVDVRQAGYPRKHLNSPSRQFQFPVKVQLWNW